MVRKSAPLAQQAADEILSGIRSGKLANGDGLLPSEAELSLRFEVSRATIREALAKLEHAGVIIRKHGVGTFVAPPQPVIDAGLEELESLETLAERIGLETHMSKASIEERAASAAEAVRLQLAPADQVLSVARVIMTGKRPVAYLIDIVPLQYLRQQDLADTFNGSVLDLFLHRERPALSHSRTDIMAEAAQGALARQLHLQRGDVLLKLEAQLVAQDGQVVDYSLSYFVPGYLRFHVVRRVGGSNTQSQISNLKESK
jgi:GntR family transcriptional regulator